MPRLTGHGSVSKGPRLELDDMVCKVPNLMTGVLVSLLPKPKALGRRLTLGCGMLNVNGTLCRSEPSFMQVVCTVAAVRCSTAWQAQLVPLCSAHHVLVLPGATQPRHAFPRHTGTV